MGYTFAKNLDRYALKPEEIDIFIAAIRDGAGGKTAPIDVETYTEKIQKLRTGAQRRGVEGREGASAEFEAKEAARRRDQAAVGPHQARHQGRQRRVAGGDRHREGPLPRHAPRRLGLRLVRRARRARRVPR